MKRPIVTTAITVLLAIGLYLVWDMSGSPTEGIEVEDNAVVAGGSKSDVPDRNGTATEDGVRQSWLSTERAYTASIVDLDEKPVAGLKLVLGQEPHLQSVETDERGRFMFRPGIAGAKQIRIAVQDSKWMLVDWMDRKELESIKLPADREKVVELRVHPMLYLAGRVLDENGAVSAGAQILMYREPSWRGELLPRSLASRSSWLEMMTMETSDDQGRFRVAMPVGAPVQGVKARTGSAQESEIHDLAAWWEDPTREVTLQLQRLGKIQGQIRFVGMEKPKLVSVTLRRKQKIAEGHAGGSSPVSPQGSSRLTAQDDEWKRVRVINATPDHRFLLEDLLPGRYQVLFNCYDRSLRSKVKETSVLPGATRMLDVTFGLEPVEPRTDLSGSVVDQEGRGIDGMLVSAWQKGARRRTPWSIEKLFHASVLTDAQGRFTFSTPEGLQISLSTGTQAKRTDPFTVFDAVQRDVEAGTTGIRIQVRSHMAGVIQGRILFLNGKVPAPYSTVRITREGTRATHRPNPTTGTFSIRHVPPGEHEITAYSRDFGSLTKTVRVTAKQVTPALFQFEPPQALRGQVVDSKGQPVPNVNLWVNLGFEAVKARRFADPATITDKAGRFEIPGFGNWGSLGYHKRGVYIVAYKDGHAPLTRLVETDQEARQLRLVLRRQGNLYVRHLPVTGTAFGLSFDKAALYHLNLKFVDPVTKKLSDVLWRPYTPGKPHVHFPRIPAGNYQLLLQALPPKHKKDQPIPSLWRRVSVQPGDVTTVDWRKLHK